MFRSLATTTVAAAALSLALPAPGTALLAPATPAVEVSDGSITPIQSVKLRDEHRSITVRGMLDRVQSTPSENGSHIFLIRDEYGHTLRVRSTESVPDRRVLYEIQGTVSVDRAGRIYLSEEERSIIPLEAVASHTRAVQHVAVIDGAAIGERAVTQTQTVRQEEVAPPTDEREAGIPAWAWLLGGVGMGLIGLVALRFPGGGSPKGRGSDRRRPAGDASLAFTSGRQGEGGAATREATPAPAPTVAASMTGAPAADRSATATRHFSSTVRVLPAWLERTDGQGQPIRFFAPPTGAHKVRISLGRDSGRPYEHVQLDEQTVSRKQAALNVLDGEYLLENLSGTNPTQVNGQPVGRDPIVLSDGDLVQLGEMSLRFRTQQGFRA